MAGPFLQVIPGNPMLAPTSVGVYYCMHPQKAMHVFAVKELLSEEDIELIAKCCLANKSPMPKVVQNSVALTRVTFEDGSDVLVTDAPHRVQLELKT